MRFGGGFPFGGMGGDDDEDFGGFPFGGGRPGGKPKEIDNTRLYTVLGVAKDANANQIKKAYHVKARTEHPDKGGDEKKFKEISEAYGILSDGKKRDRYDKMGEDALKEGGNGGGGHPFADIFGGGRQQQQQQARVKPIVEQIEVTLEEIYNGKEFPIEVERQGLCDGCNGVGGSDPSAVRECGTCDGRGAVMAMQMLGPGMYTQSRKQCGDCDGEGKLMDKSKMCKKCRGKKVARQKKQHKVQLEKGMPHGEKIELKGHGHQVPDMGDGDLIVVVGVKKHPIFTRKGADLYMRKEVSLYQALTGVEFTIKHLDGRKVRIQSEPGMVIDHESKMTADGLGMPFFKKSFVNGNLFITFDVKFPKSLTELQMTNLTTALSEQVVKMKKTGEEEKIETAKLTKMLDQHKNINAAGGKHGRDSDDEQEEEDPRLRGQGGQRGGPGGMECQQQ